MATASGGVTLFPGVESTEEFFLATMEEYDKEMGVESFIDIQNETWMALNSLGGIETRASTGAYKKIPMRVRENDTVKSFSGYDDLNNTPQESLEEGRAQWGQIVGVQMYNDEEMRKNSGKEQIIDLVEEKYSTLQESMTNYVATDLMGSQAADGRKFDGLGRIVTQDVSLHGIDPTDATKPWAASYWNPVRTYKTGTTAFALSTEFETGRRKFFRELRRWKKNGRLLLICGADVFDAFQAWAEDKIRMTYTEVKNSDKWGDAEMIKMYGNRSIVYDDTLPAKEMWGINLDTTKVRVLSGANFQPTPWQMMEGKLAKKRNVIHYMMVYTRNRRANGKIVFS